MNCSLFIHYLWRFWHYCLYLWTRFKHLHGMDPPMGPEPESDNIRATGPFYNSAAFKSQWRQDANEAYLHTERLLVLTQKRPPIMIPQNDPIASFIQVQNGKLGMRPSVKTQLLQSPHVFSVFLDTPARPSQKLHKHESILVDRILVEAYDRQLVDESDHMRPAQIQSAQLKRETVILACVPPSVRPFIRFQWKMSNHPLRATLE